MTKKLLFFNKHHLLKRIDEHLDHVVNEGYDLLSPAYPDITKDTVKKLINEVKHNFTTLNDIQNYDYLLAGVDFENENAKRFLENTNREESINILKTVEDVTSVQDLDAKVDQLTSEGLKKRQVFETIRFALSGSISGLKIPLLINFIGLENAKQRIRDAIEKLSN